LNSIELFYAGVDWYTHRLGERRKMAPKQRMRIASEKHSQNVTSRGNVPKSIVVSFTLADTRALVPLTPIMLQGNSNLNNLGVSASPIT
jgi:hypothetical protein